VILSVFIGLFFLLSQLRDARKLFCATTNSALERRDYLSRLLRNCASVGGRRGSIRFLYTVGGMAACHYSSAEPLQRYSVVAALVRYVISRKRPVPTPFQSPQVSGPFGEFAQVDLSPDGDPVDFLGIMRGRGQVQSAFVLVGEALCFVAISARNATDAAGHDRQSSQSRRYTQAEVHLRGLGPTLLHRDEL
jgi:hypothetical protein